MAQPRFSPDGERLGYLSDETGWRNLWSVGRSLDDHAVLVAEAAEHGGPTWGPGARTWAWVAVTRISVSSRSRVLLFTMMPSAPRVQPAS